jgi:hypothetical protein
MIALRRSVTAGRAAQRGVASIALALMLLIMVSVAAITLARMASSSLGESTDMNLSVAALAAADSALERASYRLGTMGCTALAEAAQMVGAPNSTQASYQVLSGTGINGGCRVRVQSYVGDISNPRVLRLSEGDIAGGVVLPQDFPLMGSGWVANPPVTPPWVGGSSAVLGNAVAPASGALVARTPVGADNQFLQMTADWTLAAPFTADASVPIPMSFYWRKNSAVLGSQQLIAVQLLDSGGGAHQVWSDATIANTGWTYVNGSLAIPASANGLTITGVRLWFDLAEGATGSRVGAGFDRVQVGGLIAWRELAN